MSSKRRGRNKRRNAGDAHVRLYGWEMQCPAYRTLSVAARALLVEFRALFDVRSGDNRVFLSVREMMRRLNLGQRAAQRARDELCERGWVSIVEPGGFSRKTRHATVYALENEPPIAGNGSLARKTYARWQPPAEAASSHRAKRKNTVAPAQLGGSMDDYRAPDPGPASPLQPARSNSAGSTEDYRHGERGSTGAYTDTVTIHPQGAWALGSAPVDPARGSDGSAPAGPARGSAWNAERGLPCAD